MSRSKPCVNKIEQISEDIKKIDDKNSISDGKNSTSDDKNSTSDDKNSTSDDKNSTSENKKCQFCLNTFSTSIYKKKHEKICKFRKDEIRNLEIELDIEPLTPESKTECRFCNKNMSRLFTLKEHKCKERVQYQEQLLKQKQETNEKIFHQTINNGIINNTIVFNSPRSLDHIEVEKIIQFLRDLKSIHLPDQTYDKAGELVIMMENYIQEDPKNKNFIITDYKSPIGYIKNEENWTITTIDKPLNSQFKETAGILCDKKEEINNVNEKVFKNNTNCEIFNHVEQFNNKGFNHVMHGEQKMKVIKSNYKITKLKNKKVCDF
jgi:hypothetical protein